MKGVKENPFLDGSVMSKELTLIGKQIQVYIDYANKIARTSAEQTTELKLKKPNAEEIFSKAIENREAKRAGKKLSESERKKLEEEIKYDFKVVKLGNAPQIYNSILHELTSENKEFNELVAKAKDEVNRLAKQVGTIERLQKDDVRNHL